MNVEQLGRHITRLQTQGTTAKLGACVITMQVTMGGGIWQVHTRLFWENNKHSIALEECGLFLETTVGNALTSIEKLLEWALPLLTHK